MYWKNTGGHSIDQTQLVISISISKMFFTEFFFVWEQVIKILNIQTACELFTNIQVSKFN